MPARLGVALAAAAFVWTLGPASLGPASAPGATRTMTLRSPAFDVGGFETVRPKVRVRAPGVTGYLVGMRARLVDLRGRQVPIRRVMLHHLVFLNGGRPGAPRPRTSCAGRRTEPFWGTGEERQPLILPGGHGYRVRARDRWRMQVMLMSHSTQPRRVRIEYRMRFVTGRRLTSVKPLWLRANGCTTHPSYDVHGTGPPGSEHRKSALWRMPHSGRIVAASAHLHAGSRAVAVSQPRCGDRELIRHEPLYGHPGDPVYRVRPVLHEPGPVATGHFVSPTGLPVRRGEHLRVTGLYDADHPRPGVMAISHVYIARDRRVPRACAPRPADARILWTRTDGRRSAERVRVPLTGMSDRGFLYEITRPPGPELVAAQRATVAARGGEFRPANVSVPVQGEVRWDYLDGEEHNVVLADGPHNVVAPTRRRGSFTRRFRQAGEYRLFCTLHPLTMHQVVRVRDR